jgi:hypothetical protein
VRRSDLNYTLLDDLELETIRFSFYNVLTFTISLCFGILMFDYYRGSVSIH